MSFMRALREILTPGKPQFKARIASITEDQARLLNCLHLLEQPVTRSIVKSTDEAAEFPS